MLRSGCFGDIKNRRVGFRIDHEDSMEVASTDDALSVMIDDEGIQFRLDLGRCKAGPIIARMCSTDNRASMSVGCDIFDERKEVIDGETVRVVTRARLSELTLCKEGCAGESAFAMVVEKTFTPKPVAGTRSVNFRVGQMLHKVSRGVRKLKAQAAAIYGEREQRPKIRWPTIDESNRMETAEIARLQEHSRRYNLF